MLRQKFSRGGVKTTVFICLTLIAIAGGLVANKQLVIDQLTVWKYKPTAEITALVNRAGMDDSGKFIYYASQPKLDATQQFNSECDRVENITSILGCYSNNQIYIYDVTDPQLDGVREVTAAHETLHAVYGRMDDNEKKTVDVLVEAEYTKLQSDKNFQERMAFYARSEPGQRDNELHSMIGTEIANISPELEAHYKKYFTDRQKVVVLNAQYIGVFQKLENQANDLAAQLNTLADSITTRSAQYQSEVTSLNIDKFSLQNRMKNIDYSTLSKLNADITAFNNRVAALNSALAGINSDIVKYNDLLAQYNSIASQSNKLHNSIDSTLAPVTSI